LCFVWLWLRRTGAGGHSEKQNSQKKMAGN
jgi:hypothetical protein